MKRFQSSSEEARALPAFSSMESNRLQVRNQPAPPHAPPHAIPPSPTYGAHRQMRTPSPWRYSPYGRQGYSQMMMPQPQPPQPQPQQLNFESGGVHHQNNMIPNVRVFNNREAEAGHHPTAIYNYYLDPEHSWNITITAVPVRMPHANYLNHPNHLAAPVRMHDVVPTDVHHPNRVNHPVVPSIRADGCFSNHVNSHVVVPVVPAPPVRMKIPDVSHLSPAANNQPVVPVTITTDVHDDFNRADIQADVGVPATVLAVPDDQDDADETELDLSLHL